MLAYLDSRYAVLGLTEGIVLALGFGARIVFVPQEVTVGNVVLNAGVLAAVVNLVMSLFTELYQQRAELLDIERKMVISDMGRYFHTALYRTVQLRTLSRAASYSISAFAGAAILFIPLSVVRQQPLLGLLIPLACLFGLGFYLGRQAAGNPVIWAIGMVSAGLVVTVVGLLFPA